MIELAQPDAYPLLLLKGRIAFRKAWAMRARSKSTRVRDKDQNWLLEYDEEFNFAHAGARYIDDENWGLPKVTKKKSAALSAEATRFLVLARMGKSGPLNIQQRAGEK